MPHGLDVIPNPALPKWITDYELENRLKALASDTSQDMETRLEEGARAIAYDLAGRAIAGYAALAAVNALIREVASTSTRGESIFYSRLLGTLSLKYECD